MKRFILVLMLAGVTGCSSGEPSIVFEITSPGQFSLLRVAAKRYLDSGAVVLYPVHEVAVAMGVERASLLLELPEDGRYAIHFVDVAADGTVYAVTRCQEVRGVVEDRSVVLSAIGPELDADGDTFPEDAGLYCAARAEVGLDCDEDCLDVAYSALADCNPPVDYVPSEGCGERGGDAEWNPFVTDLCGDCLDRDCWNGDAACVDVDGDGYPGGIDCDDDDAAINPGALEVCGNGVDENCRREIEACDDGDQPCDADGDGAPAFVSTGCGTDCDDSDSTVFPGAQEVCDDGTDNNCNGVVDEGCFPDDIDQDGVPAATDCNDCDSGIGPRATEQCGDGIDQDCTGSDQPCHEDDHDGDGVTASAGDCDDDDRRVYPGAPEHCGDGNPQNCIMEKSCDDIVDGDLDAFGGDDDCDDGNAAVHPWALEVCDVVGVDEDCDGVINEVLDPAGRRGCGWDPASSRWFTIDFATDARHCGECRHDCTATGSGDRCVAGECQCGSGALSCAGGPTAACCVDADGSACVDLSRDTANCGFCGHECRPGETCEPTGPDGLGECRCAASGEACPSDECWHCCPDAGCLDLCSDVERCGACDRSCTDADLPLGNICSGGVCHCGTVGEVCTGTQWCTDLTEGADGCSCADLERDPANCGACGHVCEDGVFCTENHCVAGECVFPTLDADDDGWCAPGCNDNMTGERGECRNFDCDDSNDAINPDADELCSTAADDDCDEDTNDPGAVGCTVYMRDADNDGYGVTTDTRCLCEPEWPYNLTSPGGDCDDTEARANPSETSDMCNGYNDDCDVSTADGADECPGRCCGVPADCRECCSSAQCPAAHDTCSMITHTCVCEWGYSSCAGTCDCNTGAGQRCCSGSCVTGVCCAATDCGSGSWTCTAGHACECAGIACGGTCYAGGTCCDSSACTVDPYTWCDPASHTCMVP